jgi:hypothetical protein
MLSAEAHRKSSGQSQHHASAGNPCSFEEESGIADDLERHCAFPWTRTRKNLNPIPRKLIDPGGVIEEHCTGATL